LISLLLLDKSQYRELNLLLLSGYYLYIETTGQKFGDRARLGSPLLTGQCILRMFYHMYGQHVNALVVYMRTTTNGPLTRLANMSGNIGDNWIRAEVKLSNNNQPFQIVIEGQFNRLLFMKTCRTEKKVAQYKSLN